jgi:hypothetical protein
MVGFFERSLGVLVHLQLCLAARRLRSAGKGGDYDSDADETYSWSNNTCQVQTRPTK